MADSTPTPLTDAEREQRCRREQISHEHYAREDVERIVAAREAAARAERDDRLITCPECRSTFEAEDDTITDLAEVVAAARADERDLRRVLSAYSPGWDGTLHHLVQILTWPLSQHEAARVRAALAQSADTEAG